MDDIINKIVKLPTSAKLGALAALVVAMFAGNWYYYIKPAGDQIKRQERTLTQEKQKLIERQAIANDLNRFRREMELLEQKLAEALTQMPAESRMDDLINQLAENADNAGLQLTNITPQAESRQGQFYYSIPVRMQVSGSYHEIAVFLDMLSRLRRIVNVTNIQLGSPRLESEKVVLQATYLATTFRFAEEGQQRSGDEEAGRSRRRR